MDRVGRAHRLYEYVDVPVCLRDDLLTEAEVAGECVLVVELVGPPMAGSSAQLTGGGDHPPDELLGDLATVAGLLGDLGTEGKHRLPLLKTERVREHHM